MKNIRLMFVLALATILAACSESVSKQVSSEKIVTVEVSRVEERQYQAEHRMVARVEAVEDVDLYAQVQGYLIRRHFNEGDEVEAGQLLFEIDDRLFVANVDAAEAELAEARAEFTVRELNKQRGAGLLIQGGISQAEMDTLNAYQLNAEARVERLIAKKQHAKLQLSFTRIKAPFSGRISDSKVALGQLVNPSTTLLANLVSISPVNVSFRVSELERERLNLDSGSRVDKNSNNKNNHVQNIAGDWVTWLELPSGKRCKNPGAISYIDNRIDVATGTLQVKATFANQKKKLLPGQYVDVVLMQAALSHRAVPLHAIQKDSAGDYLLIVDSDFSVSRRDVVLGSILKSGVSKGMVWVVVEQGLRAGEYVISRGLQHVKAGSLVRIDRHGNEEVAKKTIEQATGGA